MFVWNHFTNDARVLREATALSEAGYEVDVIAIHDPDDPKLPKIEKINNFTVKRVKRYPDIYVKLKGIKKRISQFKKKVLSKKLYKVLLLIPLLISLPFLIVIKMVIYLLKWTSIPKTYIRFSILLRMIREGLKKDYDIYHSHDLNTLPQGYICKLIRKKKLIYDSHEVQTSRTGYKGKKYYYLEKFLIKRIDKMIMTTNMRAEYTAKKYGIEKPVVIHNYPFFRKIRERNVDLYSMLNIPREEPILLYQGGMQEGRGLEKIIEAIPWFKRGVVVFIGDGKLKDKIIKMCEKRNLNERVRFLPKVPVDELLNYTQNAYLGFQVLQNICFNHYSTLSNKLFEYIMAEVPVIASDFPEIRRVVEGNKVGLVIDPHESKNISLVVNFLLDNTDLYRVFKDNCKKAKLKYNWNNEKLNFVSLYRRL